MSSLCWPRQASHNPRLALAFLIFRKPLSVFGQETGVEEWSPLHQLWHLMMRASNAISALAQASLPHPKIGTWLPPHWPSNLNFPVFLPETWLFWSSSWRARVVATPPTLAPRAENKWCHLCNSLGETATNVREIPMCRLSQLLHHSADATPSLARL